MDNVVIIQSDDKWDPRRKKYFHPRFAKVLPGQEMRRINHGTTSHRLVSGNPDTLISDGIFDTGDILAGQASSIRFNTSQRTRSISYFCILHPNERGTVVILPKEEGSLTNEERLELLESTFVFDNSAEFKKMHTSLEKYVDPVVVEQIRDPEQVTMQNKILTIVFWDISGFSVLCESLQFHQELVVAILREFFSEAATIIHNYDGVLDKFIGDGIMAYFGFKDSFARDNGKKGAICAANAAMEMRDFFDEIKVDWIDLWKANSEEQEKISIHLRCGMNTGNVLVGLILTEKRDQFTTIGTNVNLASRMEGVATEDQIIASPFTKMRIEDEFNLKAVPIKKPIKGFENISKCYEIRQEEHEQQHLITKIRVEEIIEVLYSILTSHALYHINVSEYGLKGLSFT